MKYLVVLLMLFFCTLQTFGQQDYFIYLQTDNNQAFYIRANNSVFSSTSSGYLILPRWPDNTIAITIGFPKNVFPEQQFNIPANHKDAGYLIKNFTDKGWVLFNLQTQAVIANSNPPEEKKNPDLITTRKNDAFSMLLANAVNDSSVLYTVSKPPKPTPPAPVAVLEENKPDSIIAIAKDQPKDTTALVKKRPEQKQTDSNLVSKTVTPVVPDSNKPAETVPPVVIKKPAPGKEKKPVEKEKKPVTDTIALVKNLPEQKDSNQVTKAAVPPSTDSNKLAITNPTVVTKQPAPEKDKKPVTDSVAIVKNHPATAPARDTTKTVSSRIKQFFKGKNTSAPKKDTIIVAGNNRSTAPVVKNKSERRDTIIIMSGKKPEPVKPIVKAAPSTAKPVTQKKTDSVSMARNDQPVIKSSTLKKDTLTTNPLPKNEITPVAKTDQPAKKTAEKITVPVTTPPVTQNRTAKPDTAGSAARKDSIAAIAKNETTRPVVKDTVAITQAPKRQRPLVNRAAEFLTDTSYIAVFIDESNPVFDTIRVSVPFNEEAAFGKLERPVAKDKTPAVTEQRNAPAAKKDSSITEKPVKDSTAVVITQPAQPAPVKNDSVPSTITATTTSKDTNNSIQPDAAKKQTPLVNNDCKDTATDSDIDKLRVKMMLANTDEDRLALAKRLYRAKCFSVKQVRALSELFKNDEGKYQWLDAVYPYVSDGANFSSLSDLLKDNYYLNRFRAMLRN